MSVRSGPHPSLFQRFTNPATLRGKEPYFGSMSDGGKAGHDSDCVHGTRSHGVFAISRYLQTTFASFIWCGVLHSGSKSRGFTTRMQAQRAREVATLRRLAL